MKIRGWARQIIILVVYNMYIIDGINSTNVIVEHFTILVGWQVLNRLKIFFTFQNEVFLCI